MSDYSGTYSGLHNFLYSNEGLRQKFADEYSFDVKDWEDNANGERGFDDTIIKELSGKEYRVRYEEDNDEFVVTKSKEKIGKLDYKIVLAEKQYGNKVDKIIADSGIFSEYQPRLAVVLDGKVIAGSKYGIDDDNIYHFDLAVSEKHRGYGVSTALVKAIIEDSKKLKADGVKAQVVNNMLYDKLGELGFSRTSEKDVKYAWMSMADGGQAGGDLMRGFLNAKRFIDYNGQFLYPPRIEYKLQPSSLLGFDNGQYIGQPKLNGSSTSVAISKKGFAAKERHNSLFAIPPKFDFQSLYRGDGFMCVTGEFMNKSKKDHTGKAFKGFCIWDIVAFNGKILLGSTIEERFKLLNLLYPTTQELTFEGLPYLQKTSVADIYKVVNFGGDFSNIYNKITKIDMVEGFVLKRRGGLLDMMTREKNNTGWAVKVRKATKNYNF